jgi:hypothetical protein
MALATSVAELVDAVTAAGRDPQRMELERKRQAAIDRCAALIDQIPLAFEARESE